MSRQRKIQIRQWLILGVAWQIMALWICVYDHLAINSGLASSPAKDYTFISNWILYSSVTVIATLIGGSILVFYINPKLSDRSYGRAIIAVVLCIVFTMIIITLISTYFYVALILKKSVTDPDFNQVFLKCVTDPLNLKDTFVWSTITAATQFIFLMNTKFGPGVFWKIITGKYRVPKAEERIFMFLDLNSSTSIAENLGEVDYHRFLKDFFAHITNPIVNNYGEIYQYVGDEIIIRSMCKELNVELIASHDLLQHLSYTNQFNVRDLGSIELRGKKKKIELSSLSIGSRTSLTVSHRKNAA